MWPRNRPEDRTLLQRAESDGSLHKMLSEHLLHLIHAYTFFCCYMTMHCCLTANRFRVRACWVNRAFHFRACMEFAWSCWKESFFVHLVFTSSLYFWILEMMFSTCSLTEVFMLSVGRPRPWTSASTVTTQEQKSAGHTAITPPLGASGFVPWEQNNTYMQESKKKQKQTKNVLLYLLRLYFQRNVLPLISNFYKPEKKEQKKIGLNWTYYGKLEEIRTHTKDICFSVYRNHTPHRNHIYTPDATGRVSRLKNPGIFH